MIPEKIIHRLNANPDDVKAEALEYVKSVFKGIAKAGEAIYLSPVYDKGAVVWLGLARDIEGNKTGGGLFQAGAFRSAYMLDLREAGIEGVDGTHQNVRAGIYEISRDELIDLLYFEQQKQMKKSLEESEENNEG